MADPGAIPGTSMSQLWQRWHRKGLKGFLCFPHDAYGWHTQRGLPRNGRGRLGWTGDAADRVKLESVSGGDHSTLRMAVRIRLALFMTARALNVRESTRWGWRHSRTVDRGIAGANPARAFNSRN